MGGFMSTLWEKLTGLTVYMEFLIKILEERHDQLDDYEKAIILKAKSTLKDFVGDEDWWKVGGTD